jgi:hypothetical protein
VTIVASAISPIAIANPASEKRLMVCLNPTSGTDVRNRVQRRDPDRVETDDDAGGDTHPDHRAPADERSDNRDH